MNWHDNTSIVIISYSIKLHMCVSVCLRVISASKYITHRNLGLTTGTTMTNKETSRYGLEVVKAGQIANRWLIGLMVDGSMVIRLDGQ